MRWAGCWGKRSRNRDSMGGAAPALDRVSLQIAFMPVFWW